ncbi:MAG TPA: hypothetical protein VNT79_15105 [Phycisphaerae bacterium]|nr:hypothetical protein [Phycisphaerae bacterium]
MLNNPRAYFTRILCFAAVLLIAGCSDAQKQDWNEFWGVSEPKKQSGVRTASKKKAAPSRQTQTASGKQPASRSRAAAPAKTKEPSDRPRQAEPSNDVNQDVGAYSARMKPVKETEYQPNDHTSKIHRQQDPNRQKRIHHVAHTDQKDEPVSGSTSGGDALERYERNTGVPAEAEVEGVEESEPGNSSEERPLRDEPTDTVAASDKTSPATPDETESDQLEADAAPANKRSANVEEENQSEPSRSDVNEGDGQAPAKEIEPGKIEGQRDAVARSDSEQTKGVPEGSHPSTEVDPAEIEPAASNAMFAPETPPTGAASRDASPREPEPSVDAQTNGNAPDRPSGHEPRKPVDSKTYETGSPASDAGSNTAELEEISISAAPEAATGATPPANDGPAVSANSDASLANNEATSYERLIADQEKVVAADPNDLEQQYRLRMMYLVDGHDDKAKDDIPGLDADLQRIISAQIDSLISARSTSGRDPATWATRQLESIESLRRLMKERADLVVPRVVLCTQVEGFGRYKPIEPAEFKAGRRNRVLIYSEVDNFTTKQTNSGMYRTLLSTRQTLMTKDGKEIWSEKSENIEDLARGPRRDFFLSTLPITIPKSLPPGDYVLKVEIEDVLAGKINSNSTGFKIVP